MKRTGSPGGEGIAEAASAVLERLGEVRPKIGIVLGSGLGALADAVDAPTWIPFHEIPGFPEATVAGHAGELVAGSLESVPVLLQVGRYHLYEGHAPKIVALPVRVMARVGIDLLILTNAAGGLRRTFCPPLLMLIADHLNLMWRNPLLGAVEDGEERFPDLSDTYDAGLRALARQVANEEGIELAEGTYAGVLGPSYETPAEIQMLRSMGADAVGMSTVPEVLVARASGVRLIGISSITNWGAGLTEAHLSHEAVLTAGRTLAADLETLIRGILRRL